MDAERNGPERPNLWVIRMSLYLSLLLLLIWGIIGAVIFHIVESPVTPSQTSSEDANYTVIIDLKDRNKSNPESAILNDVDVLAINLLQNETSSYAIVTYWRYSADQDDATKWDLMGSLLFCFTVISTIGYGHLAPATDIGKVLVAIYSIVGIPICFHALSRMRVLAHHQANDIHQTLCNFFEPQRGISLNVPFLGMDNSKRKSREFKLLIVTYSLLFSFYIGMVLTASAFISYIENWNYLSALYYNFVSITTIGFGDLVGGQKIDVLSTYSLLNFYRIFLCVYIFIGMAYTSVMMGILERAVGCVVSRLLLLTCFKRENNAEESPLRPLSGQSTNTDEDNGQKTFFAVPSEIAKNS